ncbi:hypothetical protein [Bradyrhizobium tropiciagri]|uniref:hypothetical protein n=1 Tax=Bradyrhizobium tropiciagri TaxID=312253 RepID=UPI00067E50A6|nr:hypothetical protein [Bradyrhizobium tropiciagri]
MRSGGTIRINKGDKVAVKAAHAGIDDRYRRKESSKPKRPSHVIQAPSQIHRLIADMPGGHLPDTKAGRNQLFAALCVHVAVGWGEAKLVAASKLWAPSIDEDDLVGLINRAFSPRMPYGSVKLGRIFGVTYETRLRLSLWHIHPIDKTKAEMARGDVTNVPRCPISMSRMSRKSMSRMSRKLSVVLRP